MTSAASDAITIALAHPLDPELKLLHERHTHAMHEETPPESIHMMPADALAAPEIRFYALRKGTEVIGMGAFKIHDPLHAEIKSMHILSEHRGGGLSRRMVDHLIEEARALGIRRLSLETGVQPGFTAARGLYERMGFTYCGPFADYTLDPNSVFMTREI